MMYNITKQKPCEKNPNENLSFDYFFLRNISLLLTDTLKAYL